MIIEINDIMFAIIFYMIIPDKFNFFIVLQPRSQGV